ncbi:hypothetical protein LIER_29864 [Lithospermum erythrorhizon]|uniref:Protein POLYCHOME-like n=1 Tax=Lithospermum erythrorhizon TaxID=34254 RepID=A0AAV3RML3_LITER
MAEARDRRVRAEDIAEVYIRRRRSLVSNPDSVDQILAFVDQLDESTPPRTALRWRTTPMVGTSSRVIRRFNAFGSPRNIRGRSFRGVQASGRENVVPGGSRGRARGGTLPTWYPRRPLQDITSIVRAIERRRARTGEDEGQSSQSRIPFSTAHFEHDTSLITPEASSSRKPSSPTVLEVPKILLDITNDNKEDSEFLTPQKKLLNSIDSVEKVVMEELNKQKRTPSARKAERKKKVKTLMSMR